MTNQKPLITNGCATDAIRVGTYNVRLQNGDVGPRLDYIYVSPGVRVKDYRTVSTPRPGKKLYPSDHFPVTATVEL